MENIDVSTNTYIHTTSELVPLADKIYHLTLGLQTTPYPNIKDALELVDFQRGTSTYLHSKSWKRRLKGIIVTAVDGIPIKTNQDIVNAVSQAK